MDKQFFLIVLLFFTIDSSIQCWAFIHRLATSVNPAWPKEVCEKFTALTKVDAQLLSDYIDVKIVAGRTQEISRLILYPFIVLFLMIVARASFFARWNWPPSLIIIFGLNSIAAVYAVWSLRGAAEKLRASALQKMEEQNLRLLAAGDKALLKQVQFIIDKIESCNDGAFGPLTKQPFLKAVLVPLAAVAGIAIDSITSRF